MEFEISLNDLMFYAFHGVLEEERTLGNQFKVSLSIFLPYNDNLKEDRLTDTISYTDLYEVIKEEMQIPRKLLEKLAIEIAEKIKIKYPELNKGFIKIEKMKPPIPDFIGTASVTLHF